MFVFKRKKEKESSGIKYAVLMVFELKRWGRGGLWSTLGHELKDRFFFGLYTINVCLLITQVVWVIFLINALFMNCSLDNMRVYYNINKMYQYLLIKRTFGKQWFTFINVAKSILSELRAFAKKYTVSAMALSSPTNSKSLSEIIEYDCLQ